MRFINWRFYWDYSGGNVFENMVHQVAFWQGALGLGIPESVTMTGANYRSPKMQVPDTMNVVMSHSEKLIFTWSSIFGNNYYGETNDLLFGTKGTIVHTAPTRCSIIPKPQELAGSVARTARTRTITNSPICTCRTSSIACAAARRPSARSSWASAPRSPARWPSPRTVGRPPCGGTPRPRRSSESGSRRPPMIGPALLHSVSYAGLWGQAFLPVGGLRRQGRRAGL